METLWPLLRRLQTNSSHAKFRRPLLEAILDGAQSPEELVDHLLQTDLDFASLLEGATESPSLVLQEFDRLVTQGVHCLTPASPEYPTQWLQCEDPPLTITVRGSLSALTTPSLAVVGSREPSSESQQWMEQELLQFCRTMKVPLVSGGARGIDQKAHSVALRASVPTVAFLPSGLESPYPADFKRWFPAILEGGGAIVSEYPAQMAMRKPHFHHRNRLIAASGRMVLIVEARIRSGTLITATRAAEIGRPLLTIPGHPSDPRFAGCLELLAEGATQVRQSSDLILFWQTECDRSFLEEPPLVAQAAVIPHI